jgi:hypothetical protein
MKVIIKTCSYTYQIWSIKCSFPLWKKLAIIPCFSPYSNNNHPAGRSAVYDQTPAETLSNPRAQEKFRRPSFIPRHLHLPLD